jgi:hypothetical protein
MALELQEKKWLESGWKMAGKWLAVFSQVVNGGRGR